MPTEPVPSAVRAAKTDSAAEYLTALTLQDDATLLMLEWTTTDQVTLLPAL
ncbi:hypothetical protein SAMN05216188_11949 [Lentzea xinjiangensis]|uniref:Uncharacterized protein n=1 Tax=Lentzea xinjiangensis TaxID=402600 RepID=A0A1H9TT06_9PSEU|nr:hypothetical protein SAMN05216188_11949 [Lentzea xinjiangensis]